MTDKDKDLEKFLRDLRSSICSDEKKTLSNREKDISLSTDKLLNEKIIAYLEENFSWPILSEEIDNEKDYTQFKSYYWIIDPLDGTLNFSRNIPLACVSIALWKNTNPVMGIIYDFQRDELFFSICEASDFSQNTGAWINGEPITVSSVRDKSSGIICTGFPSWRNYGEDSLLDFINKVKEWKKIRLLGSAALSLAWISAGRADAYTEEDIRIWDVAAGMALVKAAGGNIYIKKNERINFVTAIATTKNISIEELL